MPNAAIELTNVRVNNLKDVCLAIPHGQWLSICGLSGSGKSSLAFDTLFAEGQRRYMEALSVKTRQFLQQLDRPEADHISGLPPAVAIRAPKGTPGPRTTLASASEIDPLLRLLFAKVADSFCPKCNRQINRDTPQSVADWLTKTEADRRAVIAWPIDASAWEQNDLQEAIRDGFVRAVSDGTFVDLESVRSDALAAGSCIVVDRIKTGDANPQRITESLLSLIHI